MKVLFLSAGPYDWGSSRMRCYWPAQYMPADVVQIQQDMHITDEYGAYIFQKQGLPEVQKYLMEHGKQVWLDQCDPMWWFSDQDLMRSVFKHSNGAVFSSEALMEDFNRWYGHPDYKTAFIPDRVELSHFKERREHQKTSPVRLIWYGVSVNRMTLMGACANLSRLVTNGHRISLTIFDDRPQERFTLCNDFPIYNTRWRVDSENEVLSSHDIALLPPYPGPWGEVKSDNKKVTAYANGLPVTTGFQYEALEKLVTNPGYRAEMAKAGYQDIPSKMTPDISAKEWMELLDV